VIDVPTGEPVARGLSMPHSPRLRDGALHILQSGLGTLGRVDLSTGAYEEIAFLPGFARGMAFVGGCAVVGVSRPRRQGAFDGLALDEALARREQEPLCMLAVVDLATGEIAHRLEIGGGDPRALRRGRAAWASSSNDDRLPHGRSPPHGAAGPARRRLTPTRRRPA
jgi:hypothetical protein